MFCSLQKREFGERGVFAIGIGLISSKKGKLYLRFFIAAALIVAVVLAYAAFASAPTSTPFITSNNITQIPNASIARASDQLFFASNFTSGNGTQEANSTFKWFKRTLYQPQNRSLVGYWKLDGNATGDAL